MKKLFNEYDSEQVMDMIDNLIIENSIYDAQNDGHVFKYRASLDKDYGRIRGRDTHTATDDIFDTLADAEAGLITGMDATDDGELAGLAGIPMMS